MLKAVKESPYLARIDHDESGGTYVFGDRTCTSLRDAYDYATWLTDCLRS